MKALSKPTPLHLACKSGDTAETARLIKEGAEINALTETGKTPAHMAAAGGHIGSLKALLSAGADADVRDNFGETPLKEAAFQGDATCLKALIKAQVDLNTRDKAGWTPLHDAAANGHTDCLKLLLDSGALPDGAPDEDHTSNSEKKPRHARTASGLASAYGHFACASLLKNAIDR